MIRDIHPESGYVSIPDPGVKKAPALGQIRNTEDEFIGTIQIINEQ
jgi:hypothetical protein